MNAFGAEFTGTALVVLLGNGVVANVLLKGTKGQNSGLIVIAFGWAIAVFTGVFSTAAISGAHLNPAVTLGLAVAGKFPWDSVPLYMTAQMLGGMFGAGLVWAMYQQHLAATDAPDLKLAVFCTGPAIRQWWHNLFSEFLATFVLVFCVLSIVAPKASLGALDALPVALLVLGLGVSLGGTTGYAMSPARDLAPRLMHALLPIPGKGPSDWGYAWVPVVGSLLGGAAAALVFRAFGGTV
ncbi:MIP/aquaporin family protein [Amphibiibacter pelophylacis]|uniref:MIP/aquaporin family protein n=1 Tax=Amphibiibacter pelophylacis TaxID=1799477 RepID=A0ACC6NZ22_9BURK